MKELLLLIALFYSFLSFGQTATIYFESGKIKQENDDYKGAIKDYDRAIKIDSSFFEVYYYRATLQFANGKYMEAITDLNKTILLKPNFTKALILRGECSIKTDNKEKACEDFIKAKQLGDSIADSNIRQYFCEYKVQKGENIVFDFPEKENWKITYQSSENNQNIFLLGRSNETLKNWTEQAGISSTIGMKNVDLDVAMNEFYKLEKDKSPKSKLTFIEKDLNSKHPWIMYLIEDVDNKDCKCRESLFCYLIQGEQSFYSCFRSVKGVSFTNEQKEKLKRFFKTCEIVYE